MMNLFNINSHKSQSSNTATIVGVKYDDGIILGSTNTIIQINANVVSCHCALETETLLEDARNFILDEQSTMVTAETIGIMLSAFDTVTDIKNMLQTGVIIGGGKKIYEISNCGIVMERSNFCVGGYEVGYLNNFLDGEWKKGMNEEEAEKLVLNALSLNISLRGDRSSGIQTMSVNSKGITRAFHPHDTLLIGRMGRYECVGARLISESTSMKVS